MHEFLNWYKSKRKWSYSIHQCENILFSPFSAFLYNCRICNHHNFDEFLTKNVVSRTRFDICWKSKQWCISVILNFVYFQSNDASIISIAFLWSFSIQYFGTLGLYAMNKIEIEMKLDQSLIRTELEIGEENRTHSEK